MDSKIWFYSVYVDTSELAKKNNSENKVEQSKILQKPKTNTENVRQFHILKQSYY